ncbi:hypothetical protein FNV43_RR09378 [Rhamnella rubrinervis]|uniref:Phytocyanin domain-containing protein n=1 Tax=Rhamnella rubrinervis TaxID=2594499 RepID=A0A8K0HB41_9ROSA|nr:hypothetical protein FNV43_RR09378 [Rhamnella rubrinervis]
MANPQLAILVLTVTMGCFMMAPVSGFIHIVGGKHGWRVPHNKTYYEEWARPRTFGVGDRLGLMVDMEQYLLVSNVSWFMNHDHLLPGANNVIVVDKEDFDRCTEKHVISMYYDGPVTLNITRTGDYYFYNGLGKHCEAGQKLHITVGDKEGSSGQQLPFKTGESESSGGSSAPSPPSKS